jgi:hypothetical protein
MSNRLPPVMIATLIAGVASAVALTQLGPVSSAAPGAAPSPAPAAASGAPSAGDLDLASDMAESARRFLTSLSAAQRARAVFAVTAGERLNWHYVPKSRLGVPLKELDDAQRALAYGFLATALSRRGFVKASGIMALDEVLRRREHSNLRDAGGYFVSIFGEPSPSATWGFRLEGHHLSLNLTLVDGVRAIEAPAFLGANPARVGSGGYLADTRVLGREEDLGGRLLASLDDAQRKVAIYQTTAPADILTGPGSALTPLAGLSADRMTPAQRQLVDALLDEVTGNLPREIAQRERARIAPGAAGVVFTWAGAPSTTQPHYFRLDGPSFVYELDNTQSGGNHIHSVWHTREPGGDFGADLLRQHYSQSHTPPAAPPAK